MSDKVEAEYLNIFGVIHRKRMPISEVRFVGKRSEENLIHYLDSYNGEPPDSNAIAKELGYKDYDDWFVSDLCGNRYWDNDDGS